MSRKRIVVVGSSFAGFTAAVELRRALGREHAITVISKSDEFVFGPSLVWVALGVRTKEDVSFAVRPRFEQHGIQFVLDEVVRLHLDNQVVAAQTGHHPYDYLVIATGPKPNYASVPGLGPRGYTHSILSLPDATRARAGFEELLARPGPVLVGGVQGASCPSTREFLFGVAGRIRAGGASERMPLTYLTAETSLTHLGSAGLGAAPMTERILGDLGIQSVTGALVRAVSPGEVHLADGRKLPFVYAVLTPPFLGADAVRACDRITNASGFVLVDPFCRTLAYPQVFAAGGAVARDHAGWTDAAWDGGQAGSPGERMGRLVASNIAACIRGGAMKSLQPRPDSAADDQPAAAW
jgi:NADH dehydrogenase FAD-containing subunit